VNCTFNQFKKKAEKIMDGKCEDWEDIQGWVAGYSISLQSKNEIRRFIWLPHFKWTIENMAQLCHELIHWIAEACKDKELEFCIQNQEMLAYLTEWAVNETFNKLKPNDKKTVKKNKKKQKKIR
jgi:hypothetical protein